MDRHIPREKLGKRARRQLDSRRRVAWAVSPVTRRVESKKTYSRKRKSHARADDAPWDFFLLCWRLAACKDDFAVESARLPLTGRGSPSKMKPCTEEAMEVPQNPSAEQGYTYFAFISYKHSDSRWAEWLRRGLQSYRLSARTHKKYPGLAKRLAPVCLDKAFLRPGYLDQNLREEVQASKFLIVICSRAAHDEPKYLDDEIHFFIEGGGDPSRVLPFIVDDSPHPEQDCFPPALQALCATRDIVGTNVHKSGRNNALLLMISAMHGIKKEEVFSEDRLRRRHRMTTAAIASLAIVAVTLAALRYYLPHSDYYMDVTERWGVAEGVGKLSRSEAGQTGTHVNIITRQGLVREYRRENAAGALEDAGNLASLEQLGTRVVYEYVAGTRTLTTATTYNAAGEVTLVRRFSDNLRAVDLKRSDDYDSGAVLPATTAVGGQSLEDTDDARSAISRYLLDYDDRGYVAQMRYAADPVYNGVATDMEGIAGMRYLRDEKGRIIRLDYLGYAGSDDDAARAEDYVPTGTRTGVYSLAIEYGPEGDQLRVNYLDADGAPALCADGYATLVMQYDGHHNMLSQRCLGTNGELVVCKYGYAGADYEVDARGSAVRAVSLDADLRPVAATEGNAGWTRTYDEQGRLVEERYFDADGKDTLCNKGYAAMTWTRDEATGAEHVVYLDLDGAPTCSSDGYATVISEFDASGRTVRVTYLDEDGAPIISKEGLAGLSRTYDEQGRMVEERYLDADGQPMLCNDGYAVLSYHYDRRGNLDLVRYLDAEDRPTPLSEGYTAVRYVYDDSGRVKQATFLDEEGRPILSDAGNAGYTKEYDARGRLIEERSLDVDGRSTVVREGYTSVVYEYDDRGSIARQAYFNADGTPTLCADGYAAIAYEYDDMGREARETYLDVNGLPIRKGTQGFGIQYSYDSQGRFTRETNLGPDGLPMTVPGLGYATAAYRYDARGRVAEVSYLDEADQPVSSYEGVAGMTREHDARGYLLRESYFDAEGRAMPLNGQYAIREYDRDSRGNAVAWRHLAADGQPAVDEDGVHEVKCTFDARDRLEEIRYYDAQGSLVRGANGYAAKTLKYDAWGRTLMEQYYDESDQPRAEFATAIAEYDRWGRRTVERGLGANGESVLLKGAVDTYEVDYGAVGNEIESRLLDENGALVDVPDRPARTVYLWDDSGRRKEAREEYDASGALIDKTEYRRGCVAACPADEDVDHPDSGYVVFTRLGDWDIRNYLWDESSAMLDDFVAAMMSTEDDPAEACYLRLDPDGNWGDDVALFADTFTYGKMNMRIFDYSFTEHEYLKILNYAARTPSPAPMRKAGAAEGED